MKRFLLVLFVALAACGPQEAGTIAEPSPTKEPSNAMEPEATEWFLRSISEDGKTIAFVYTMSGVASGCQKEGTPDVEESDDVVIVTANKLMTTDKMRACTEEAAYVDDTVTLDEPLGSRALVGCRPPKTDPSEDDVCRDLERSREYGVFEFSPPPASPQE